MPPVTERLTVLIVAAMLFILAASNGRPMWTSSGLFMAVLAPFVILARNPGTVWRMATNRTNGPFLSALLLFLLANMVSAVATPTDEALIAAGLRCILPLLVYLALTGLVLRERDARLLLMALAAGCGVMFGKGLLAYYNEFGIPDLQTILWSRYNVERIAGYADATLGNVSRMGLYVVLVVPILVLAAARWERAFFRRAFLASVAVLGVMNLIVSGSRTGLVVLALSFIAILFSFGVRRSLMLIVALGVAAFTSAPIWLEFIADPEVLTRYIPTFSNRMIDDSAEERLESVLLGWQHFLDHIVFGIGPGNSPLHNPYNIPHQSIVHQFAELGLIGGLTFVWLNLLVLWTGFRALRGAPRDPNAAYRLLWLIGPASWLIFGIAGGIAFNASFALVWVGIAHAMMALSGAAVLDDRRPMRRGNSRRVY